MEREHFVKMFEEALADLRFLLERLPILHLHQSGLHLRFWRQLDFERALLTRVRGSLESLRT
jgi:hypothetical protein